MEKKERLAKIASAKVKEREKEKKEQGTKTQKKEVEGKKPYIIKYGINHITALIEAKKPKLVIIAHDVDPIEIVLWLPALCRKMEVPYVIVKGKARLGTVVHKKTATALAIVDIRDEDKSALNGLITSIKINYNDKFEENRKQWGGGIMGFKSQAMMAKREKIAGREIK